MLVQMIPLRETLLLEFPSFVTSVLSLLTLDTAKNIEMELLKEKDPYCVYLGLQ